MHRDAVIANATHMRSRLALSRALASGMSFAAPSPITLGLPSTQYRNSQLRVP
jgi:hypothetical protein